MKKMYPLKSVYRIFILFGLLLQASLLHGDELKQKFKQALAQSVTADLRPIFSIFDSIEDIENSEYAEGYEKYQRRFIRANEVIAIEDPFIARLSDLYSDYWRKSLLEPKQEKKAKRLLKAGLEKLAQEEGREVGFFERFWPGMGKLEKFLTDTARKKGYYVHMGYNNPLRDLLVWKKEARKTFQVKLPDTEVPLNVIFAHDFVIRGWLDYATFSKSRRGGWCDMWNVYCLSKPLDEDNEWFRVSVLGHEGRHMSDFNRFVKLDSWVLEYRAKLTEICLADTSFWDKIQEFSLQAKNNSSIPHAYAAYHLIHGLVRELTRGQGNMSIHEFPFHDYSREKIKDAAFRLIEKNTRSLKPL